MTRKKSDKKSPHLHSLYTPKGMAVIRRILPRCQQIGAQIGREAAISALECYDRSLEPGKNDTAWSKALDAAEAAVGDSPTLNQLDRVHGAALADTSDEAFLTGFYAGLAAVKGGAR